MILSIVLCTYIICTVFTVIFYRLFHPWRLKSIGWSVLMTPFAMVYAGAALGIPAFFTKDIVLFGGDFQMIWNTFLFFIFATPLMLYIFWSRRERGQIAQPPGRLVQGLDKIGKLILTGVFILFVFSLVADRLQRAFSHDYHPILEKLGALAVLLGACLPIFGLAILLFYDEPWMQVLLEDRRKLGRVLTAILATAGLLAVVFLVLQSFLK